MSVWYVAHDDELMIDLDDATRPTRTGAPWIEVFFRRRLRDAMLDRKLDVRDVYLAASASRKHYHAIVRLERPMSITRRLIWQDQFGSDLYRGRADRMRADLGFDAPSLIIRAEPIEGFYRPPDRICACVEKHRTSDPPDCDVWRELRGMSPWELFGRSDPAAKEWGVALPLGRVPIDRIMARVLDADETPIRDHVGARERDRLGSADRRDMGGGERPGRPSAAQIHKG